MCGIFAHLGRNCPCRANNLQSAQSYLQDLLSLKAPLPLSLNTAPKYKFPYIYSKQTISVNTAIKQQITY